MSVDLKPVLPAQSRQLSRQGSLDRPADARRPEAVNNQKDVFPAAASALDLGLQLLNCFRDCLA
jgi:hypothetical protein